MGDVAPDFEARSARGPIRLSEFRGRLARIFFTRQTSRPLAPPNSWASQKLVIVSLALECVLLGLSVDLNSHLVWMRAISDVFDIEVPFAS